MVRVCKSPSVHHLLATLATSVGISNGAPSTAHPCFSLLSVQKMQPDISCELSSEYTPKIHFLRRLIYIYSVDIPPCFFCVFLQAGQLLWYFICFPAHQDPLKRVYSNRKDLTPFGSKFFPLREDLFSEAVVFPWAFIFPLTLVLLNPDIPCLCKQCRSRSVGFWRSQLIWLCTVCH